MKVFQVNTVCGSGSTGRIVVNLARMLEQRGDECLIAYARGSAPDRVNAWKFGSKLSIYYHGIMTRITDRHGMYSKHATKQLIQKIKEYDPDLIHLHNIHGYYVNIELLFQFLKEYNKPVVWTLHDCWSFTGHCSHYTCVSCDKWKTECSSCPLKRDYPGSLFLDNSRENYRIKKKLFTSLPDLHLITPSDWLKQQVENSFFFEKNRTEQQTGGQHISCTAIPNGIETDRFVRVETDLRKKYGLEDKIIILGIANVWTRQKGFEDFIQLSHRLDERYQLVMVGVDEKRKTLLQDRKNILALGHTKNIEELIEWYSAADIYFNSSIEETMGMTTGEAICCGTPVITYDLTAVPESVGPDCGIVASANHVEQVKTAIEKIVSDRQKYIAGCLSYRENFKEEKANEAYYGIYQKAFSQFHIV